MAAPPQSTLPFPMKQLISVGYERRTPEELVTILRAHKVKRLIDVREYPQSRRPGFSKSRLAATLESAGIEYLHMRNAGNPHRQLKNDIKRCLRLYRSHLHRNRRIVREVAEQVNGSPVAFLCYEREHSSCHRSILLEKLAKADKKLAVVTVN